MTTQIDLDDLERYAHRSYRGGASPIATLALIARIRELEMALCDAASIIEGTVQAHSQHVDYHDDLDWKSAQAMRWILEKGVVLP